MDIESQILIFVIISGIFLVLFISIAILFLIRLKSKDYLLKESGKKLKKYSKNLELIVAEKTKNLKSVNEHLRNQIEEREKLEKKLIISERLASIGELAAGLAHKIRNPLTIISSTAQFIESNNLSTNKIKKYTGNIIDSANKADEIIKSLLKFSSYRIQENDSSDLTPILQNIIKIIEPTTRNENIKIITDIPPSLSGLKFDCKRLEEVFSNLIFNAIDAMKNGGELSIMAKDYETKITIDIIDTGVGISVEKINKIFIPFFYLKKRRNGIGFKFSS
ncbi:MAG: hypothetical protein KGY75_05600 [Candidatus Cloacimonetes bacterium]|nr:hypothetical protein [Candidatus Cloacimonadota bacterium]MBS3767574.1 hypothetical protein [Candidatus Cloacimonadota bacterium]